MNQRIRRLSEQRGASMMHGVSYFIALALMSLLVVFPGCAQSSSARASQSGASTNRSDARTQPEAQPHSMGNATGDAPAVAGAKRVTSPAGKHASSGYETAAELIELIKALPPSADSGEQLAPAFAASTPEGQRLQALLVELFPAAYEVQAAMMEQFGEPLSHASIMDLDQYPPPHVADASVVRESEDKVVYEIARSRGEPDRLGLIKLGESWWIDLDEMSEHRRRSLAMLEKVVPAFVDVSGEFAGRILRGEFETAAQANAALQRAMAEAMMSRMGLSGSLPPANGNR